MQRRILHGISTIIPSKPATIAPVEAITIVDVRIEEEADIVKMHRKKVGGEWDNKLCSFCRGW